MYDMLLIHHTSDEVLVSYILHGGVKGALEISLFSFKA